uniref:Uncharacterized protein n=1 Tax=Arundo donax TaxID=35708 RepID=A0A0A8YP95_ARUDO
MDTPVRCWTIGITRRALVPWAEFSTLDIQI